MKTEISEVSPTRKEIKIEIEAADVRAEFERVTQEYARAVTVPGFRKGHAPVGVVRTRYKKDIQGDVLKRLVPEAVEQAIEESGFQVIGQPDVHLDNENLDKLGEESVTLHAHVEVMPELNLGEYRGLEAARRTRPVTEEEIERVVENLREASASLQPVEDRPSQEGDTVTVDFQGRYVEPQEEEDINVSDVDVVLGSEGVLDEFNEALTGVQPDEVKTFTVKYPDDFGPQPKEGEERKGLAGKTIEYTATVTAVRRKEVPALDDDWVKSLGEEEVETVEQLRVRVRENLSKSAEHESEHRLRDEVLGRLIERHRFEVPETIVSYQANQILQSMIRDMISRGADPRTQDINWEAMRDLVRERAGDDVRGSMLLERVAEAENIEVTQGEIDAEIESIAEGQRQSVEQVRAALTKQGGERSIADRLRNRKALDFLVQHAQVRDEEWREEEPAEGQPAEPEEAAGEEQAAGAEGS
ncbi:MAG: trigger factor [Acidobacteria bacterium]|nr:trigger factor [Acidobacteriota bacterium]MBV9929047.1 trigger factor [Acidobacteriota bacterium]